MTSPFPSGGRQMQTSHNKMVAWKTASAPGTPQAERIKSKIESFLLSLPLDGADPGTPEVERAVAERLYEAEVTKAALQEKLHQW